MNKYLTFEHFTYWTKLFNIPKTLTCIFHQKINAGYQLICNFNFKVSTSLPYILILTFHTVIWKDGLKNTSQSLNPCSLSYYPFRSTTPSPNSSSIRFRFGGCFNF